MDFGIFSTFLFPSESPAMPNPSVMRLALHGVWAIVLGSAAMSLTGKMPRPYQLGSVFLVMFWTLLPGNVSPAYWLGLAFQTPSLMSAVICLVWLMRRLLSSVAPATPTLKIDVYDLKILTLLVVVSGWVLWMDMLAWLPVSLYAWGFGSMAFVTVTIVSALLWVLRGSVGSALYLIVLTLFVLTRLPTGNVWDALLDPWLWVALQVGWLINVARRRMAVRRSPQATRV